LDGSRSFGVTYFGACSSILDLTAAAPGFAAACYSGDPGEAATGNIINRAVTDYGNQSARAASLQGPSTTRQTICSLRDPQAAALIQQFPPDY